MKSNFTTENTESTEKEKKKQAENYCFESPCSRALFQWM